MVVRLRGAGPVESAGLDADRVATPSST